MSSRPNYFMNRMLHMLGESLVRVRVFVVNVFPAPSAGYMQHIEVVCSDILPCYPKGERTRIYHNYPVEVSRRPGRSWIHH